MKEYIKFANQLYDDAKSKLDHFSEADLVQCVLLSYNDLSNQTEDESLIKCKVFLEYSYKFIARQQKVRRWQNEKGISHQMQYRSTEKVQSNESYRYFFQFFWKFGFYSILGFHLHQNKFHVTDCKLMLNPSLHFFQNYFPYC